MEKTFWKWKKIKRAEFKDIEQSKFCKLQLDDYRTTVSYR